MVCLPLSVACGDKDPGSDNPETIYLQDFTGVTDTYCSAESEGGVVTYSGVGIIDYHAVGYNGSADPGAGYGNVYTRRDSGECTGQTTGRSRVMPSSYGDWDTNGGENTYANCFNSACGVDSETSCSGDYEVVIEQPPPEVDPCSDFNDGKIVNSLRESYGFRVVDEDHTCTAGSGTFTLLPVVVMDRDGDGAVSVTFLPAQLDGTGTLTMNAWITGITVNEDAGNDLRLLDPGVSFSRGYNDLISGLSSMSTLVSGTHTFSTGEHSGFAPFVVEEMDKGDIGDLEVELTWTCGSGATAQARPSGYVVDLESMDCGVEQDLVMRVLNSPNRVQWELYGAANYSKVVGTVNAVDGREFTLQRGDLYVKGTVRDWDATEAEVRFDAISYDGVDLCETGTYTFPAE